jgi:hypothetical protein
MKFVFHPETEEELNLHVDYYNQCQANLGWDFAKEVYSAIQNILTFPNAWTVLSKNTRRCLVNRFPFGILYQKKTNEIVIVAIMQLNRKPDYWQGRISQNRMRKLTK